MKESSCVYTDLVESSAASEKKKSVASCQHHIQCWRHVT